MQSEEIQLFSFPHLQALPYCVLHPAPGLNNKKVSPIRMAVRKRTVKEHATNGQTGGDDVGGMIYPKKCQTWSNKAKHADDARR